MVETCSSELVKKKYFNIIVLWHDKLYCKRGLLCTDVHDAHNYLHNDKLNSTLYVDCWDLGKCHVHCKSIRFTKLSLIALITVRAPVFGTLNSAISNFQT